MERGRTRKARVLMEYNYPSVEKVLSGGVFTTDASYPQSVTASQITDSYSNPSWFKSRDVIRKLQKRIDSRTAYPYDYRLLPLMKGLDFGSSFWTVRQSSTLMSPDIRVDNFRISSIKYVTFIGRFFAVTDSVITPTSSYWPTMPNESAEILFCRAKGAFAINATIPTKPMYSLTTALGELYSDGLPSLVGSTLFRAKGFASKGKSLGSEYLNMEFGWKPLVSDLISLCKVVSRARIELEKYEANSGKLLRRNFEFPLEKTTTTSNLISAPPYPPQDGTLYVGSSSKVRTLTRETERRVWFTGSYQYYLPPLDESRDKIIRYASEAEKLLGLRITPEVLWNLAPWSWLSDWFFNFGNILSNVSALSKDNCVLRHGYIMCSTNTTDTYVHPGVTLKGYGNTGAITQTFSTKSKMRRRASPYGFGVTWTGFSPRQIAILAALGISRDWRLAEHL